MPSIVRFEEITADLGAPLVDGASARNQYRLGYYLCAKEAAIALQLRRGSNRISDADFVPVQTIFGIGLLRHDLEKLWVEVQRVLSGFL